MYKQKDIAVVILNWNGKALLQKFLPPLLEHSGDAAIYLADNASTDDSINFVSDKFPSVRIIKNDVNGGYAKGYNDALSQVNEALLCLLNSDIEVTNNWLEPILQEFNTNEDTAIIQPKILDYTSKRLFEYAGAGGGFIDKYGYPYCRGRVFNTIEEDKGQYNDKIDVFWASGACFFIRNAVFKHLHGFDELFFAHMEEIDLCWRAFNDDHKVRYIGLSTVYHVGGATLSNTNPRKTYLNFRNSLCTLVKNADKNVFTITLVRMTLDGIAGIRFLLQLKPQHFFAILKAHASFYTKLRSILKARKSQKKRSNYYQTKSIVWSYFIRNKKYV